MGIREDIERLIQEGAGLGMDRNPFADLDEQMGIFGGPRRRDQERERVN